MTLEDILDVLEGRAGVEEQTPEWWSFFRSLCQDSIRKTMSLNCEYHPPEDIPAIMADITGREVDPSFRLFPPFYTDFGKNIHIGLDVFVNSGCHLQDQGGIWLGDGALVGHSVVMATVNHSLDPKEKRKLTYAPIRLEGNVWIGSHATILPGVTIGEWSVVAAGAVVAQDVPPYTVVAGVPARPIRQISPDEPRGI